LRLPFLYLKERNKRIYISFYYMVATASEWVAIPHRVPDRKGIIRKVRCCEGLKKGIYCFVNK
jgi:hypothetical protein